MQLRDNVQNIIGDIFIFNNEHPYEQRLKSYTLDRKDLAQLELILPELIPNIIITHSQSDTQEEIEIQNNKLKNIYAHNMYPYYIDLNVKKKSLIKTKNF